MASAEGSPREAASSGEDGGIQVGLSEVALAFFAGRYEQVLAETLDSPRGGAEPQDQAFVIGALSFVGRVTEAELSFESLLAKSRPGQGVAAARTLTASAFFLAVAYCRAAHVEKGRSTLVAAERVTRGSRDAWSRSMLWQGVACCHFFGSSYRRAERATTHALQNALEARFAYTQLLANDMRGHLLLRRGRLHEGLVTLRRARQQAMSLRFSSNAHAIEISHEVARAATVGWADSIAILNDLLRQEHAQDSYSRRDVLVELAMRHALAGQAERAGALVDEAAELAAGDPRAEAAVHCARAQVHRARSGWAAALPFIDRADALLRGAPDAKRAAEVAGLKLAAARWRKDDQTAREAAAALRRLHSDAGLYAAGAWLFLYGADSDRPLGFVPSDGDQSTRLLTAVTRRSVDEVVQAGLLGLLPEALGQEPGRRIVALPDLLIIEDHGDVRTYPGLAPRCRQVLEAIARGEGARGQLLQAVWGIGHYRPERHDSVIKTTVSRLRSALGDRSAWLVSRNGRYELVPGVEAQLLGPSSLPPRISAGEGVPDPARLSEDGGKQAQRRKRVLHALSTGRASSAGPLARVLGLPLRTVSRELSALHERGLVTRTGSGPATRYHVVPPKGTPKGT